MTITTGQHVRFRGDIRQPVNIRGKWLIQVRHADLPMIVAGSRFDRSGQIGLRRTNSPRGRIDWFASRAEIEPQP